MAYIQLRNKPKPARRISSTAQIANDSHGLRRAWSLFFALFLMLMAMAHARAETEVGKGPVAALPVAPISMTSVCDNGVAVFTVQNKAAPWASRGWLRVSDAATGRVLRLRHMVLGDNQTASFRIQAGETDQHRYQVAVVLPGKSVVRVKRFTGRCVKVPSPSRTARR